MLKEHKDFFLYILGIIALIIVTVVVLDVLIPGTFSKEDCGFLGARCLFSGISPAITSYDEAPSMMIDASKDYYAVIKTNKGDFQIDLFEKNAPVTVNNFVFLTEEDYYDGVLFHRVISGMLIQSGDRNTLDSSKDNDGEGNPGFTIGDEINWPSLNFSQAKQQQLENLGYSSSPNITSVHLQQKSLAMANKGANTNGSQFFIVTADSNDPAVKGLDGRHTVFGAVESGWDVVMDIDAVEVDETNSNTPRPIEDVIIQDIVISTR